MPRLVKETAEKDSVRDAIEARVMRRIITAATCDDDDDELLNII